MTTVSLFRVNTVLLLGTPLRCSCLIVALHCLALHCLLRIILSFSFTSHLLLKMLLNPFNCTCFHNGFSRYTVDRAEYTLVNVHYRLRFNLAVL